MGAGLGEWLPCIHRVFAGWRPDRDGALRCRNGWCRVNHKGGVQASLTKVLIAATPALGATRLSLCARFLQR